VDIAGKNFFRTVARCTGVEQFEGKVREMVASRKAGRDQISFLFKFPRRVTMVNLTMIYDPARNEIVLLIGKVQQEGVKESERGN
jgi:hypothetical protein